MYDVIIIGAGISGLVCGCYLAKAGMKVLIIEQHNKPGGYFTSFRRGNFLFDAAAHSFGSYRENGYVRKILTEIGIDKLIKIIRFDPSDIIITPDFKIVFWNNTQRTIADLITIFPKEKDNIIDFFNFIKSANQSEFMKLKDKTFGYLLRSFFKDEKLINALAFPVFGNGGLPPSQMHAFSGAKIFSEFIIDGGYYPEGGIQKLPDALAYIVEQNGGRILYKRRVKKILINNNSVIGIKLDNNEKFISKYVVSACDMMQTFKTFLGKRRLGKQIDVLKNLIPSISTFILYIGFKKTFEGLPPFGTNIWYMPHYDLEESYSRILKCKLSDIGLYMLRVSPNKRTISAFIGAPFRTKSFWEQNKKKIAEKFLQRIEELIPALAKNIRHFEAATPFTSYRYTLNYKGAAFGWAKMPSQTFDPLFSKSTFIKGLFLTGHWTSIAFGMPGASYSGQDTAKRILRKENLI